MTSTPAARILADRCPGVLRPHRAADGAVVRLRLAGGRVTSSALTALSGVSGRFADGRIQLTSRGNLQLRGMPVDATGDIPADVQEAILATGLVPSITHELVRNIICSPLTGRIGGVADLRPLLDQLDLLLCSTPALTRLSGRFLFVLDDGRRDVIRLTHDLGVRAVSADRVQVTAGGLLGPIVSLRTAARVLIDLAVAFLRHRDAGQSRETGGSPVWHVRQLPRGGAELFQDIDIASCTADLGADTPAPVLAPGVLRQPDGNAMLSMAVPLGLLDHRQVQSVTAVAARAADEIIVSPWRLLLVPDVRTGAEGTVWIETRLDQVGLDLDPHSGWLGLSACAGAPGCGRAAAPTGPMAELIARHPRDRRDLPIHVVACERRCGAPSSDHVEVMLRGTTSRISRRHSSAGLGPNDDVVVDAADLSTALTSATALARTGS